MWRSQTPPVVVFILNAISVLLLVALVALPFILVWLRRRRIPSFIPKNRTWVARSRGFWTGTIGDYVDFEGKRYRVRERDRQVCDWLTSLVWEWQNGDPSEESHRTLLEFRDDFRSLTSLHPIGGLVCCLRSPNRELRRLAIWLLGRSAGGATVNAVKTFRDDPDPRIRREVAKTLRRMAEWTELRSMAWHDEDARVRSHASTLSNTVRRPYAERLGRFVQHAGGEVFEPGHYSSHMPVFMVQPVGPGKPAKSRDFIRRVLEHIRELVRSRFKNHAA